MSLLDTVALDCPYCGERIEVVVDRSVARQAYVEDCEVCCRPLHLAVTLDDAGTPSVAARRDDDA